jgi:mannitol-specific phosphotransferase system IIBC component
MDQTLMFFLATVLIVAGLLFAFMTLSKKGPKAVNVDKYRTRWLTIEQQLKKDEVNSYSMVVINADKLVDQALMDRGYGGQTMGERMKKAQTKWSNVNAIWTAHKLRNQIAHEPDVRVSYDDTRRALASFRQALKDLGAI